MFIEVESWYNVHMKRLPSFRMRYESPVRFNRSAYCEVPGNNYGERYTMDIWWAYYQMKVREAETSWNNAD